MLDEDQHRRELEALLASLAVAAQAAAEEAVQKLPDSAAARLSLADRLAAAGQDIQVLANACAALIRLQARRS